MRSSVSPKKVTLEEINALLNSSRSAQDFNEGSKLYNALYSFILSNEFVDANSAKTPQHADELSAILTTLAYITESKSAGPSDVKFRFLLLKILRILSRRVENRQNLPSKCFKALVMQLQHPNTKIASEGASILLNICYEKSNVESVIAVGGLELLAPCLENEDEELKANAAGAVQSISYQKWGREYVQEHSPEIVIGSLVRCLNSANARLCARAVGALHNLSTNLELVLVIRDTNGIVPLVRVLSSQTGDTARSAAGTIMNISREAESRKLVKEAGAVAPLTSLLFGSDVPSQTSALGALLNILGADMKDEETRNSFKQILSLSLVLGITNDCLPKKVTGSE
eukprot:Phypoly_transcript_07330.p1 GENE.Phypoly_transcript_07330~~Phypoly_transcript_07330.p1  ORF type:complete len:343 (+),score=49.05 Phypoly_transcript_07330:107-1135(+)